MENNTLVIDFYEFTMGQTYFDEGKVNEKAYFDIFFRTNPFNGGYTIAAGLDKIIDYIKNFNISDEDIDFLRSKGNFSEDFLNYLRNLKFNGDIYAVPEGTPVFPGEPVITVRANIIEAQLIETSLLACFNHGTLVATATKRIINETNGIPVMEFGARRARGTASSIDVGNYSYIAGCAGTSNTLSSKKYNIPLLGTMAHSLVQESDSEYEAFLKYAKSNPDNCVFLVDTYDTLREGIPNAIKVAKDYLIPNGYKFKGIRIDSGDLTYLSKEARKMLDEAGFKETSICLSNGLDEYQIRDLLIQGANVNSFGAGDNISASNERVGGVYKLAAIEKDNKIVPKIKVSNDAIKTTNPGFKKVYRFYDKNTGYALGDLIALAYEKIPTDKYTLIAENEEWKKTNLTNYLVRELQVPIFKDGVLVYDEPSIEEKKKYCQKQMETLYPEIKRLVNPHKYYVDLSLGLLKLKKSLIYKIRSIMKKEQN